LHIPDRTRFFGGSALLTCALLAGCQHTGFQRAAPSPRATLLELPASSQQEADGCGVVTAAVLCAYHGVALPEEEQVRLGDYAQRNGGLSGAELCAVLNDAGLKTELFEGTRADLFEHIEAGRPVLTMISLDGEEYHYCLVNGFEPEREVLYVLDPRRGQVSLSAARFEEMWDRSHRFTLVAASDVVAHAAPAPELDELRAGDLTLSDRELKIIGFTALGILLLILIF